MSGVGCKDNPIVNGSPERVETNGPSLLKLPVEGGPSSIIGGSQYYVEEPVSPRMENRPNITPFEGSSLTVGLDLGLNPWSNQREDGLSSAFEKALNLKRKKGDSSEEEELLKKPRRIGWKNEGVSDNDRVASQSTKKEYVHKGRGIRRRGRRGGRARGSVEAEPAEAWRWFGRGIL